MARLRRIHGFFNVAARSTNPKISKGIDYYSNPYRIPRRHHAWWRKRETDARDYFDATLGKNPTDKETIKVLNALGERGFTRFKGGGYGRGGLLSERTSADFDNLSKYSQEIAQKIAEALKKVSDEATQTMDLTVRPSVPVRYGILRIPMRKSMVRLTGSGVLARYTTIYAAWDYYSGTFNYADIQENHPDYGSHYVRNNKKAAEAKVRAIAQRAIANALGG